MPAWDHHLAGIEGVRSQTQSAATDLHSAQQAILAGLHGAAGGCGSPLVAGALSDFENVKNRDFTFVINRIDASMAALRQALQAYIDADRQMADYARAAANAAPDPTAAMPSFSGVGPR